MGGYKVGFCIMSSGTAPRDQTKDPLFGQLESMFDIVCLVKRNRTKQSVLKRKETVWWH